MDNNKPKKRSLAVSTAISTGSNIDNRRHSSTSETHSDTDVSHGHRAKTVVIATSHTDHHKKTSMRDRVKSRAHSMFYWDTMKSFGHTSPSKMDVSLCPFTNMTEEQRRQIRDSWGGIDRDKLFTLMNEWYKKSLPLTMKYFTDYCRPKSPNIAVKKSPSKSKNVDEYVSQHTQFTITEIGELVELLESPEELETRVRKLLSIHTMQTPPVGKVYLDEFKNGFENVISQILQKPPNSEIVWLWCLFLQIVLDLGDDTGDRSASRLRVNKCNCCVIS